MRVHPIMREFIRAHERARTPGCWIYPGPRDKDGYAICREDGEQVRAHRAAYRVKHGRFPGRGRGALHRCDNRPCCRPSHLFSGTQLDNARDAMRKGRTCRGERNGNAKLCSRQVRAIRRDCRTQLAIAHDYGIRQTTVSEIKRGNRWAHL